MTTIAWKAGILAADTACVLDGIAYVGRVKICRRDDGSMAANAGPMDWGDAFRSWFLGGEVGPAPKRGKGDEACGPVGCVFRPNGDVLLLADPEVGFSLIRPPYYALGSGHEIALGVMWHGGTAEEAVRAAIKHDPYTDGDVLVLSAV